MELNTEFHYINLIPIDPNIVRMSAINTQSNSVENIDDAPSDDDGYYKLLSPQTYAYVNNISTPLVEPIMNKICYEANIIHEHEICAGNTECDEKMKTYILARLVALYMSCGVAYVGPHPTNPGRLYQLNNKDAMILSGCSDAEWTYKRKIVGSWGIARLTASLRECVNRGDEFWKTAYSHILPEDVISALAETIVLPADEQHR